MTCFVCVAPSHRGLGLSRVMLDFAASILPRFGLQEMLLWTGAPAVYESSGFAVSEQEQRVTLHGNGAPDDRSEEHTSELQSLMRISYAVFCLKKKKKHRKHTRVQ